MPDQKKKSAKTKVKAFAYKAVAKVGHGIRKAIPYVATAIVTIISVQALSKNDNDSTNV